MFEFQPSISEGDALKKRIDTKATDSQEQPENNDVVDVSQDAPIESETDSGAIANDDALPEVEESEHRRDQLEPEADADEDLYVEYKGREINLRDVEAWEQGNLRQSDYTRKTQDHAKNVDAFKVRESELNEKLLTLDAMLSESTLSADDVAELREYDPEEYIKYTEKQSKQREFIDSAKTATRPDVDMAKVSTDLFNNHPEWMENGKQSQAFKDDTNLMDSYANSRGIGQDELASFDARHYEIMLDAAKYQKQTNSKAAIEKQVRRASVSTKPRAVTKSHITSDIAALEKKVRSTGRTNDIVKLRQLKRQLNK